MDSGWLVIPKCYVSSQLRERMHSHFAPSEAMHDASSHLAPPILMIDSKPRTSSTDPNPPTVSQSQRYTPSYNPAHVTYGDFSPSAQAAHRAMADGHPMHRSTPRTPIIAYRLLSASARMRSHMQLVARSKSTCALPHGALEELQQRPPLRPYHHRG